MKHFRINLLLLILTIIVLTVITTLLLAGGRWPQGVFALIGTGVCAALLLKLVGRLIDVMSSFVSALEMNDTTMQYDIGHGDPTLRSMSATMNRITQLYRSNLSDIETSKLYYDRILRFMSHEMRNSVTPIISLTADMERNPAKYTGQRLREALGVINSQSRDIHRFLDAYWRLTHLPQPDITTVDAAAFFSRIRRLAAIEARNRGLADDVCRFSVGRGMTMEVDTALLTQTMINLLRNALDAVRHTGSPEVTVTVSLTGGHPYIVVSDNGSGIDPDVRDLLFQPFISTKPDGSGVGLCLSRQIVRLHGGDLRLMATSGPGTTLAITLP